MRAVAFEALGEFIPFFPVYAVLFAETGLSTGQISSLMVIWSLTGLVVEVPTGALADLVSRRLLLVAGPVVVAAGYATWTLFASYWAFAAGFVLWGLGSALMSGSYEAYVYDELAARDAVAAYPRIIARGRAVALLLNLTATASAAWLLPLGGYALVGGASVAVCLAQAAIAVTFPPDVARHRGHTGAAEYLRMLRAGVGEVRHSRVVRRAVLVAAGLASFLTFDEYFPLLAGELGASVETVALLMALTVAGQALGALAAERTPPAALPWVVLAAGLLLGGGALSGHPAGFVPIAVGYGLLQLAIVVVETRLQDAIEGEARATVTSVTGLLTEVAAIATYLGVGVGSAWLGLSSLLALLAAALLPPALHAAVLRRVGPRVGGRGSRVR